MQPAQARQLAPVSSDAVTVDALSPAPARSPAIAPDLPGYGSADKSDRFNYTVDGYARHLGGIIDQLGIYRAHLVLHDFGGPWGLTWAAQHPDRFASVTLINSGVLRGYRWH